MTSKNETVNAIKHANRSANTPEQDGFYWLNCRVSGDTIVGELKINRDNSIGNYFWIVPHGVFLSMAQFDEQYEICERVLTRKEVSDLRAELETVQRQSAELITGKATINDIAIENGSISIETGTELATVMANQFREVLGTAENYVEMSVQDSDGGKILVTVQRCDGKTPHELRRAAEAELVAVKAQLETLSKGAT